MMIKSSDKKLSNELVNISELLTPYLGCDLVDFHVPENGIIR